ncbi:MAG: hypothetical protein LUE93_00790 [Bacteroides sp.]|nr:hypothetical protein [Bacteroides sp.]
MVNTIYKDHRGFVWIGTQLGLDRFDGVEVKPVPSLKDHSIFAVCETDSSGLWIATDKGLFRMDYIREKVEPVPLSGKLPRLTALYPVSDDFLLAGSREGLYIYEKEATRHLIFDRDVFSLSNLISDIKESQGDYWITTADGLIALDSDSWTYTLYRFPERGKERNDMTTLLIEGDTIYIGTRTAGIITFHLSTRTFHNFSSLENHHVKSLDPVGDSILYVSTNGGGIKQISSRTDRRDPELY